MESKVYKPLFTLRGHDVSVTALANFTSENNPYLLSGDDEGTIIVWNLSTFRKYVGYPRLASSRVQSLKVVNNTIDSQLNDLMIVQSREHGVQVFNLSNIMMNKPSQANLLVTFPTYGPLFSRGDASNIDQKVALLAYPSCIENHLVTIRIIGDNVKTIQSGTAQRFDTDSKKTCSVFDIKLVRKDEHVHFLFVGYEDGCLCLFTFNPNITKSVPHLNVEGLKIDLVKTYDFQIGDFLSAFDVINPKSNRLTAVLGSPLADVVFLCDSLNHETEQQMERVKMKRKGVSTIAIRPDSKLVAIACWDSSVKLLSIETHKHYATLDHHSKQVQSLLFIDQPRIHDENSELNEFDSSEKKETNKHWLCCASMEGTISITPIY